MLVLAAVPLLCVLTDTDGGLSRRPTESPGGPVTTADMGKRLFMLCISILATPSTAYVLHGTSAECMLAAAAGPKAHGPCKHIPSTAGMIQQQLHIKHLMRLKTPSESL